jgi:hypothetical protein
MKDKRTLLTDKGKVPQADNAHANDEIVGGFHFNLGGLNGINFKAVRHQDVYKIGGRFCATLGAIKPNIVGACYAQPSCKSAADAAACRAGVLHCFDREVDFFKALFLTVERRLADGKWRDDAFYIGGKRKVDSAAIYCYSVHDFPFTTVGPG